MSFSAAEPMRTAPLPIEEGAGDETLFHLLDAEDENAPRR